MLEQSESAYWIDPFPYHFNYGHRSGEVNERGFVCRTMWESNDWTLSERYHRWGLSLIFFTFLFTFGLKEVPHWRVLRASILKLLRESSLVSNSLKFKESLSDIISVTLWVIETKDKRKQSEIRSLGGSYQMRVTLSNDLWEFWKFNFEFSVDEFHERLMTIRRDGLPIANWFGWVIRRK